MHETGFLVPIRYPLQEGSVRTLKRAIELADEYENAHLYILYVNLLHKGVHVERDDLVRAVKQEFDSLPNASYHVRNAFLLEEAILYEAIQQDVDYVVIGKDTRARWRQILSDRLDIDTDLEVFLQRHLNTKLVVV
ncbi:universal stress protein [Halorussus halophilus]|uniref:universal stress protein n=1 Tax=Halorussus halophilus TaxID=2650975 RepID=UPI00130123B0|nr:universal stress protein [Halorussus halophilus]